eukprot:GFUD01035670.1.p1 GENE.GFUD01035670.1~~GFUD01035670.1.p1  ORF type:complete len:1485 (+),score=509.47 GFUD01035670.1:55-4509(+)
MSHFNFVIPLNRDDLFEASSRNQYTVENVYNTRDLKIKLQDCTIGVQQQGAEFVLNEGFDVIFSLLQEYHKNATFDMKQQGFDIVVRGMGSLVDSLALVLNSGQLLETDDRVSQLNCMKMMLYLFCQLVEMVDMEQASAVDAVTGAKQKGKKKTNKDDDFTWDWDQERLRAVTLLYNLVQLNLNTLFDPPMMEEEVINLIASTMFKILENPVMAFQNKRDVRLSIMQVLGTVNKKYNYTLSCSLKFIQHLKHFEHLVSVLGQATEVLVKDFNCTSMVMELVREISRIDTKELARDTSGTRSYSLFLVDLAERLPESMKPSVSLLTAHLDGESYSMRKCVLGVLGEIVAKVLSGEDLDENGKDDRDSFLDCLEDHVHDIHAHVRSHVLQIWGKLCKDKCIPLSRQHSVLELAAGRLQDKSSNVRKAAVQLLTTLLESNPFAAKLQTMELEIRLKEEEVKLREMDPEETVDPVEHWNNMESKVLEGIKKELENEEETESEKVWEKATVGEICERISGFLEKNAFAKALSLLKDAQTEIPEEISFKLEETEAMEENATDDKSDEEENATDDKSDENDSDDEDTGAKKANEKTQEESQKLMKIFKKIFFTVKRTPEPSMSQSQNQSQEELNKQRMLVQYLTDSVKFSKIIHKSLPIVAQLLGSKQSTDILEAIDFFVSAFEFGVLNAMIGVRRMLALIWSRESTIKDAVVGAYKRLYINVESNSVRSASAAISQNLIALIVGATLGELTSMEKLVSEFVASKDIGKGVFTVLWEYFTGVLPGSRPEDARAAITLLGMCALSEVSLITSNIQVIVDHGLGEKGQLDFRLAQHACQALLRMVPTKLKQDDPNPPTKFEAEHQIFQQLEKLLVDGVEFKQDQHYMPMAKNALMVIYQLGESPDTFASEIIKKVCLKIRSKQQAAVTVAPAGGDWKVDTYILSRLCFLAGQVALCQLNYLDVNVFNELKRRNHMREVKVEKDKKEKKDLEKKKAKSALQRSTALETPRNANQEEDDMSCVGAEADDAEAEFIRHVCEKEILFGPTLLTALTPVILSICSNPTKYPNSDLRASASLALSKFMLVSSEFCDKHLQLLFTVLEKATEPVIRANLIIALGDLSFRFPNTVEPWTPRMYARLHDDSISVRSNTLTVLTHLILNDMIKVKGQISDMAFCIVDEDSRISGLAKLFFSELSKKGNTLYNVMPDIVSRLSDPEKGIVEDNFRMIMKYIIGLIEKDKLLESLVEKLCHRFRATRTERQWRDIAYCLSLFPYSDRSIKKLADNFPCWSDKLHEDSVYDSICVIFAGVKKGVGVAVGGAGRGEAKQLMEELETKVEEARAKGVVDHTAEKNAQAAKDGKKKGKKGGEEGARKGKRRSGEKGKKRVESSDSEEEEEEEQDDAETGPEERTGKSVDESDEEEPRGKRGKAGKRGKKIESSDEESEEVSVPEKRGGGKRGMEVEKSAKKGKKRVEEDQIDSEDDFQDKRVRRGGRKK